MDKKEFMRVNQVNQMPKLVQVLASRLYDAAYESGRATGFREGVDATAAKEAEIHKRIYDQGAMDANHWGSAAFTAAACKTMRKLYRFGKIRLKRVVDGIGDELVGMIDPAQTIKELRQIGIRIEYDDMLTGELEGEL